MRKILLFLLVIIGFTFAFKVNTLKGKYRYGGSMVNGQFISDVQEFNLERVYDKQHFDAYVIEPGRESFKYQSGNYKLKGDTCLETETFNAQSAFLTNKTIHYYYEFRGDTLILRGILPNGKPAEEHWVKEK